MAKSTVLVVIDMQRQFASARRALPAVQKAIAHAKREGWPIVNVLYQAGPAYFVPRGTLLLPELSRILLRPNIIQVNKHYDDGGKELSKALWEAGVRAERYIFCGVNATACVQGTVDSFARKRKGSQCIISDAVADWLDGPDRHKVAAKEIKLPNVVARDIFKEVA